MGEKLFLSYLRCKLACMEALEDFGKEEKGASPIVASLLLIVIAIAVAAIFRQQLVAAVTGVFEQLLEALGV